ncbi:SAM-dependent methyltransferase [Streptomyces sp. CMB-StM0423]|uniref:SAM-dependent methyltransferase n=1 Tax=Streptomyces sp. CMB-StM0423 TaxID=2059884 RepID=UPI000C6FE57C|nr:SAM-dependent methyltransferase [Streptomyces sp. CMB-StM0423]AUH41675.1 hypothetical protein CXR04_16880 [Streptomyces sp. CMB-StM0423]
MQAGRLLHRVRFPSPASGRRPNQSNPGHEYTNRSVEQIAAYVDGLELVDPGVVSTPLWRPDPTAVGAPEKAAIHCGVARKP